MKNLRRLVLHCSISCAATLASAQPIAAQCLEWSSGFDRKGGLDRPVRAIAQFDDGTGPAIYAGGDFGTADGINIGGIAKRVGSSWVAFEPQLNGKVYALEVFDDGSGPALYVGGLFNVAGISYLAKWDGSAWSSLGSGVDSPVYTMCVHDDGSGPALFAGGSFVTAGGVSALRVAKWNGAAWSPLGSGLSVGGPGTGVVLALTSFDDGAGPALYAGGSFNLAGSLTVNRIAKWNGSGWSALGSGLNSDANALAVFDAGSGDELVVGGSFTTAGGTAATRIAKWNGSAWSALGSGVNGTTLALEVYDDGGGPLLYAGGLFTSANGTGADHVATWSGSSWSALPSGLNNGVYALSAVDVGSGPQLCAGGAFKNVTGLPPPSNSLAPYFSTWNAIAWTTIESRILGLDGTVDCMITHDDGSGPSLFVGGTFTSAGTVPAKRIARFDGTYWWPLGSGLDGSCESMAVYDDGSGPALIVAGQFWTAGGKVVRGIAKWDGAEWSDIGGNDYDVDGLAVFDDGNGPQLYAAGKFNEIGGVDVNYIAKWNGSTWSGVGSGLCVWPREICVHDDGTGAALYATGIFQCAGVGNSANRVAKWNGSTWSALGSGICCGPNYVEGLTLASFDDGNGPALYVGGTFQIAGGLVVNNVAKWKNGAWSSLAGGADDTVVALATFDDGSGPALYAGGWFDTIGGVTAPRLAKWDGASWSSLSTSTTAQWVHAFGGFDDGSGAGAELYVGGQFPELGGKPASNIGRWGSCHPGTPYCFGDDVDPFVTTDCPCGNFGSSGHGCAHSFSVRGARLSAIGTTTPNTIVFTATDLPNNTLCTFLAGNNDVAAGFVFGDGVRCTNVPILRFGQQLSGQSGNPPFTAAAATVTQPAGVTRYYQCQYRNPTGGYCDPGLFNLSNGYKVTW